MVVSDLYNHLRIKEIVEITSSTNRSTPIHMKKFFSGLILTFVLISMNYSSFSQRTPYNERIDSLINAKAQQHFNGIILIKQDGRTKYSKITGFSNVDTKTTLKADDQFVIGSISKQITAVLVLQEYEKGNIKLDVPIRHYLPAVPSTWADSVTVHQLLTHTHGIIALDKLLLFTPGTQYAYSQIGFKLLAEITEKTSGKSFAVQSSELFKKCNMKNTFHPGLHKHANLVKGYTVQPDGSIIFDTESLVNPVAAGGFISTASDLIAWNDALHTGKLLEKNTYAMMITKQKNAVRNHPIFGVTHYGYGITIDTRDDLLQLGQTGLTPGFVSMDFYFPETKTSLVVLSNIARDPDDLEKIFSDHIQILKIVRESALVAK